MTTAKGVLQELDALRAILAKPIVFTEGSPIHAPLLGDDRLGRAIEAAEEEVDAAASRTHEVQRSMLRRKEQEVYELQRLVAAKEHTIESMRDQAVALRQGYEQKLAAAESSACRSESEVGKLRAEVLALRAERDELERRLSDSDAAASRLESEAAAQAQALGASLQAQGRELAQAQSAAQRERRDKELVQLEVQELKRELDAADAEGRAARAQAASTAGQCHAESEARRDLEVALDEARAQMAFLKEAKELEVGELRRRLRAERGVRKACERWLRAELRSREEMEALLLAVRDTAFGRPPRRDDEV
ncbi:hypothetical protein MNEG_0331 [Monoraphidium neglectum]|uniref:Uncharacterized protein n=1 Tax=Monoraphidium neglectum TaxID=145388 RepID=A0A0D2NU25_9CHLO|nr:hypothetical protein MNEG_0331 [Monoraphidium neglectum]KIZ07616.1 hypothetical protein MNEG_0331 [Monoraphidium neglectum]|eukprot:XP_013906635.1 hypothetical protein MNEG_0331 [Monoraphidium neglectum]